MRNPKSEIHCKSSIISNNSSTLSFAAEILLFHFSIAKIQPSTEPSNFIMIESHNNMILWNLSICQSTTSNCVNEFKSHVLFRVQLYRRLLHVSKMLEYHIVGWMLLVEYSEKLLICSHHLRGIVCIVTFAFCSGKFSAF